MSVSTQVRLAKLEEAVARLCEAAGVAQEDIDKVFDKAYEKALEELNKGNKRGTRSKS